MTDEAGVAVDEPPWPGRYSGPVGLTDRELREICTRLLGLSWADACAAARASLVVTAASPDRPGIVMHSAPVGKRTLEAAREAITAGRPVVDWPAITEARSVNLAHDGDLLVGRHEPWRTAVRGWDALEIPDTGHWYLVQAMLALADAHRDRPHPVLDRLVAALRARREPVVRIYALDEQWQVLLLWLMRRAGSTRLLVEANDPEMYRRWGTKSVLHPPVNLAAELPVAPDDDPAETLSAESRLTPFHREFGIELPRLPGYSIVKSGPVAIADQVRAAIRLLGQRYGVRTACLKPAESGAGQRIRLRVPLSSPRTPAELIDWVGETREDYVLEAHAEYLRHRIAGYEFALSPSAHVRAGAPAEGIALQFLDGPTWQGNLYLDDRTSAVAGIGRAQYELIRTSMIAFHRCLRDRGFITGGVDFAIARVGGRFRDRTLVAMQDMNLSACGADFLRAFLAESRARMNSGAEVYAATKVIHPPRGLDLPRLRQLIDTHTAHRYTRALACVPGQWGLIGVAGRTPAAATEAVLKIEAEHGLTR